MKQINFKKLLCRRDIQKTLSILSGLISVKAGRGWLNWLLRAGYVVRGSNTSSMARLAWIYIRHLNTLWRNQGTTGVVLYTKACYVLTMQAVGGMRIPAVQQLGCAVARASDGLPRVIPAESRKRIRQGDRSHLRLWVTWFSIYRVLNIPGNLKLSTITDPGVVLSDSLFNEIEKMIPMFCRTLGIKKGGEAKASLPSVRFFSLTTSSPSIIGSGRKVSGDHRGILYGALALLQSPILNNWMYLANIIDPPTLGHFQGNERKTIGQLLLGIQKAGPVATSLPIGKLGFKLEAAGKVRVFAMVECWTQWLLHPLHSLIFKWLGNMVTDGTTDQAKPMNRLINRGHTRFWCYDLSAATDRLPIQLQLRILNYLFGDNFGTAWADVLIGREYIVPGIPKGVKAKDVPEKVSYAVGQPMGALSSWAMLALTHHFIVGWAAFRVGYQWGSFKEYAVLGDDIVIAEGRVAEQYLYLMKRLGVEIGLAKSLVSRKGVLEFAKRFIVEGVDCSPVPFKEMVAALHAFEESAEFIRKYELGASAITRFVGWGYKVCGRLAGNFDKLPRRLATIGKWRASPWGSLGHNTESWLNINSFIVRPGWLVQVTEYWPVLPGWASLKFKEWASKDEARLNLRRADLPTRGVYSGSREMTQWIEGDSKWGGVYDIIASSYSALLKFPAEYYNVFYHLQVQAWDASNSLIKADFNKAGDALFAVRTGNHPLEDRRFKDWVDSFRLQGQLRAFSVLGEREERKAKPSILLAVRLWDWARKKGGTEIKKNPKSK